MPIFQIHIANNRDATSLQQKWHSIRKVQTEREFGKDRHKMQVQTAPLR